MTLPESIVVCVVVLGAVAAAIAGSLTPELSGLLGFALGYGSKGGIAELGGFAGRANSPKKENWRPGP